jgi:hypothetical protein
VVPVAVWGAYQNWWAERYGPLLEVARQLRNDGYYAAAIVTAQTACEVYAEVVLSAALRAAVPDDVAEALKKAIPGYNLTHRRVRDVYVAFSGDRIQDDKPLWNRFNKHVERRIGVVHKGREATLEEASDSIAVVEEVIQHMVRNASWERPSD